MPLRFGAATMVCFVSVQRMDRIIYFHSGDLNLDGEAHLQAFDTSLCYRWKGFEISIKDLSFKNLHFDNN